MARYLRVGYLHFNRFIPIYDVAAKSECFNVYYMNISFFRPDVQPFTAHREMQTRNP